MRGGPAVSEAGSVDFRAASTCSSSWVSVGTVLLRDLGRRLADRRRPRPRAVPVLPWAVACILRSASSRRKPRHRPTRPWRSAVISTSQSSGSGVAVAMAGTPPTAGRSTSASAKSAGGASVSSACSGGGTASRMASGMASTGRLAARPPAIGLRQVATGGEQQPAEAGGTLKKAQATMHREQGQRA